MNKEALLRVVDILESLSPDQFAIQDWSNPCGTVRCAIGWAAQDNYFIQQGLCMTPGLESGNLTYRDAYGWDAVQDFFDMNREEADIFSSGYYPQFDENPTALQVADAIKAFIFIKEIEAVKEA